MESFKNKILNMYYDLMSYPLFSIIIRIILVCFVLILIAYFLFYLIIFGVIMIPPKMIIDYKKIEFNLITHDVGGISNLDFQLANFIHETYLELFTPES